MAARTAEQAGRHSFRLHPETRVLRPLLFLLCKRPAAQWLTWIVVMHTRQAASTLEAFPVLLVYNRGREQVMWKALEGLCSKRKIIRKRGSVPLKFDKTPGCANTSKTTENQKALWNTRVSWHQWRWEAASKAYPHALILRPLKDRQNAGCPNLEIDEIKHETLVSCSRFSSACGKSRNARCVKVTCSLEACIDMTVIPHIPTPVEWGSQKPL